jgi:hypothetical protein
MKLLQRSALVLSVLATASSCASKSDWAIRESIRVQDARIEMDSKDLRVRGYLFRDILGATYLYVTREKATANDHGGGLDVVLKVDLSRKDEVGLNEGFCAVVTGTFVSRKPDRIYLGSFFSKTGAIHAKAVHRTSC